VTGVAQSPIALDAGGWAAALAALGEVEPVLATVLANLKLKVYPGDARCGDRNACVVLDVHSVSIGIQRRLFGLYLHADTSETGDRFIAFETNGTGETHRSTTARVTTVDRPNRQPGQASEHPARFGVALDAEANMEDPR
jgi:hypothetical protein